MIITTRAYVYNGSKPLESSAIFGIVGGVIACLLFISVFAIIVKKRRQKDREQARLGQSGRTAQNRATNAQSPRQRRRETDPEPLPLYEPRASATQVVSSNDVSYDAPAAFDLAQSIAATERTGVASSVQVVVKDQGSLPLMERMAQVQRGIGELNRLMAAAPEGGYPPHSIEALKIVQLKQNIALMSDRQPAVPAPQPAGSLTRRSSYEILEPVVAGPPAPVPDANTLYARMIEIQQLLGEVDRIMSQPASLEASMQVQSLRARIADIMERGAGSTPQAGPSMIPGPSFPESAHLARSTPGPSTRTPAIGEPGQSGLGESSRGAGGIGETATPEQRGLPPPYKADIGECTDDDSRAGATSVR